MSDAYEEQLAQLEAKLQPERIRSTLAFAGLYQITHSLIQQAVLHDVHQIFFSGIYENGIHYYEDRYQAEVLSRDPKGKF